MLIKWQNGPLGRGNDRKEPNGVSVEDVIRAALDRLRYYQQNKFGCELNGYAIDHLESALRHLNKRTTEREERGVEGTHTV